METKTATEIETELFYSIIKYLKKNNWKITIEYSNEIIGKGIDFDLYQLENNGETILLAWTNWFDGELKAKPNIIQTIEKHFGVSFKFGNPEQLDSENIIDEMKELLDFKK
jgi:hypothetical protein